MDFCCMSLQVQMLDKEHLLISMGPPDAGMTREGGTLAAQSYCLLTWSIPKVGILQKGDQGQV